MQMPRTTVSRSISDRVEIFNLSLELELGGIVEYNVNP